MIRIDEIQIDEDYYNVLIHLLMNTTGLNLDYYQRNFIEKRIKSRMIRVNSNTLESYYNYLSNTPLETEKFLDCFNINYSIFFRNWELFRQLEEIILYSLYLSKEDIISDFKPNPDRQYKRKTTRTSLNNSKWDPKTRGRSLINRYISNTSIYKKVWSPSKTTETLNIWSCPCANGEEPYSIAMILDNLKNQIPGFPSFKIVASDIDADAIKKAKLGIYNEDHTKNVSKFYEKRYFTKIEKNFGFLYVLKKKIKDYVEYIEEDVIKGHKTAFNYDIIFCRYLLIYINRKIREDFLKVICNRLNSGGLLILGKTETLLNSKTNLKLIDTYNRIYLKEG